MHGKITTVRCFATMAAACTLLGVVPQIVRAQTPPVAPAPVPTGPKKRLAVLDFDYSTVSHWWGAGDWNVGRGVSDQLVNELLKYPGFSLIERNKLNAALKEQQLGADGTVAPATAAQLHKVLGVNALITGSVTQFGFDDKSIGLNGLGGNFAGGLLGGLKKKESKATVVVTARLIDPTTGEILLSAKGKGESKRGSWGGFGGAWGHDGYGGGGIDMGSSNFQDTILGEATAKCVEDLATKIEAEQAKIASSKITILGKVADVDGQTVIINVGKDAGVNVGDKLLVSRITGVVKDPDTGQIIREKKDQFGTLTITQVDAKSATGTLSGGAGPAKVGDRVESQ